MKTNSGLSLHVSVEVHGDIGIDERFTRSYFYEPYGTAPIELIKEDVNWVSAEVSRLLRRGARKRWWEFWK